MNRLLFLLSTAGALIASCSYPDDSYSREAYIGTFHLMSLRVPEPVDLDNDGDASHDVTSESNCYDSTILELKDDGTYALRSAGILIADGDGSCHAHVLTTGTWTADGDLITTTQNSPGAGHGNTLHWTWSPASQSLTNVHPEAEYPADDPDSDALEWRTGAVAFTYVLQS